MTSLNMESVCLPSEVSRPASSDCYGRAVDQSFENKIVASLLSSAECIGRCTFRHNAMYTGLVNFNRFN